MSLTSETFAGAADAGDADERAERDFDVDVFEVVVACADDQCECVSACGCSALRSGIGDLASLPLRYCAGERCPWFASNFVGGAGGDDFAAADAGAGAEVDEVVGGPHRVFVVFDDDDGVAHVAEPFEAASSRSLSRGCRPMVGSSRM